MRDDDLQVIGRPTMIMIELIEVWFDNMIGVVGHGFVSDRCDNLEDVLDRKSVV